VSDARIPRIDHPQIAKALLAAVLDLGIKERVPGPPNRGPQVDRFQPPWVRDQPNTDGIPWCASAVCAWWFAGFEAHPLGAMIRGADKIKDAARKLGQWHDVGAGYQPRPGDAFVLLHVVDSPGFDRGHTGLVLRVSYDGRTVQCIEGNARNAVRLIQRTVPDSPAPDQILGFASPLTAGVSFDFDRGLLATGYELPGGSTR